LLLLAQLRSALLPVQYKERSLLDKRSKLLRKSKETLNLINRTILPENPAKTILQSSRLTDRRSLIKWLEALKYFI